MKRKHKYWLLNDNYVYTVKELAEKIGTHSRTIQVCIRDEGLEVIDPDSKRFLIKGKDAKKFFKNRIKAQKSKLQYFEFNCFRCKKSVESIPENIEFIETGKKLGKSALKVDVRGICVHCGARLYKISSDIKNEQIRAYYWEKI